MAQAIEDLFSNSGPFDEAEVIGVIAPFITIHKDTNDIYLKSADSLNVDDKILVYCLAKKMLAAKKYVEQEAFSALEIHKKLGIKKGSVDSSFCKLKEEGYFIGSNKNYIIPNVQVKKLLSRFQTTKQN